MDKADRISVIGSSILSQAEKESRRLIDSANALRDMELAAAKEKIVAETGERLQRESAAIRHEYASGIAAERTHAREALLRRRDTLTRMVFMNVQARLAQFAQSPEYPALLLRELALIKEGYDHSASTVFLAERDMTLAAEIERLLPGASVQPDENISLGGWKLLSNQARVMIDQSFETRLRDQKEWFLEHCNLEVT